MIYGVDVEILYGILRDVMKLSVTADQHVTVGFSPPSLSLIMLVCECLVVFVLLCCM